MRPARYMGGGGGGFGLAWDPSSWAVRLAVASLVIGIIEMGLKWLPEPAQAAFQTIFFFSPANVWHGYVWQLATYGLVPGGGIIGLIFGIWILWSLGKQIEDRVGPRRYLAFFFAFAVGGAVFTSLIGLVWPMAYSFPYTSGAFSVITGLFVVFAYLFPDATILLGFFVPVAGRQLIWGTLALMALTAWTSHPVVVLPELGAFLTAEALMRGVNPRRWYLQLRAWQIERSLRRKASKFTVIPGDKGTKPPSNNGYLH